LRGGYFRVSLSKFLAIADTPARRAPVFVAQHFESQKLPIYGRLNTPQ
jgi:hypothetical protein